MIFTTSRKKAICINFQIQLSWNTASTLYLEYIVIIRVVVCIGVKTPAVGSSLMFAQISGKSMLNNDNPLNNTSTGMLFSLGCLRESCSGIERRPCFRFIMFAIRSHERIFKNYVIETRNQSPVNVLHIRMSKAIVVLSSVSWTSHNYHRLCLHKWN